MNWTPRRLSNEQYPWTVQGQRTDNARVHGRESRLAEDNDYTYRYDNEGNMVRRTLKSNSAKSTEYLYDALGRLSKVVDKSGDVQVDAEFGYDTQGRRFGAWQRDFGPPSADSYTYWVGSSVRPVVQLGGNMKVVQGYFNDPQSNELFSVDIAGSTGAPVAYWGFGTGGGTVASWARTTFSGSTPTTILGHVQFDAYGERVGEIGDPSVPIDELPQVWTGMLRDTKLDLYTVGDGNWYKSSLGMYLTQANPSDFVNPYRFAGGDPVSRESLTNFLQYNNYNNFAGVMTDRPSFGQLYGHYLNPRIFGVSQALFGVAEVIGGAASCPAIVGCLVAAHGLDDLQAGLLTAVTGEYYETLTKQAARAVTGSETAATVVDIGTGLASGAAASRLGQAGRLAETATAKTATTAPVSAVSSGDNALGKVLSLNRNRAQAQLLHALRAADTVESRAVAALIKRGKLDVRISSKQAFYKGTEIAGEAIAGTNKVYLYRAAMGNTERAAGILAHEAKHFLQKAGTRLNPYHRGLEYEAVKWQARVDSSMDWMGDAEVWERVNRVYWWVSPPPANWKPNLGGGIR